ncbi:unnamed protein product [Didymodactylos carnosus]|uniref:sn-1-specific diacylglycerol lipase n=1 Tax=Didymodactylos carnosus TaxID=1234261 RepID=A0A813VKI5_9BILA|nr:unnamed protein product [Didymodactylos carnosus]CAF0940221.1 unnamed protein product [Didymodactylos carnosus]CAF3634707.1 unnamed protein product [Didymodactylos carnosus]CAF3715500.1 unnamed protein product [Didymodactylos carnosus]
MPGIRLFGRRFGFASDDLTIPSLIDIFIRFPSLIAFIVFRVKDVKESWGCNSAIFYRGYFYPLLSCYISIILTQTFIVYFSLKGTPVTNVHPRRFIPYLIYIRLLLIIADISVNIVGLIIIVKAFYSCGIFLKTTIIVSIALSWMVFTGISIMFLLFVDLSGFLSPEKKWELRLKFIFCCGRPYGNENSSIRNIITTLNSLFEDEQFDYVPSDLAAGLILLQQEDVYERRSLNITKIPPIELLKEGHQYATLEYLLTAQSPVLLYANFMGAFHRAPFFVAADKEKKAIIISIRGTLSPADILTDINAVEIAVKTETLGTGYCHSGMHLAASFIIEDIGNKLDEYFLKYPDYTLVCCGYSLGAGVAAILSILYKSKYPSVKCYGIGMPGSVMSRNLALKTEDFIFSFIVDVDLITRASLSSLEYLRNRIVTALNTCHKSKLTVLTKTLFKTAIKSQRTFYDDQQTIHSAVTQHEIVSMPSEDETTSTTHMIQSPSVIFSQSERLVLPGTIVHLYSTDSITFYTQKISYNARLANYDEFFNIIVHPRMMIDHFPSSYKTGLQDCVENYERGRLRLMMAEAINTPVNTLQTLNNQCF